MNIIKKKPKVDHQLFLIMAKHLSMAVLVPAFSKVIIKNIKEKETARYIPGINKKRVPKKIRIEINNPAPIKVPKWLTISVQTSPTVICFGSSLRTYFL